MRVGDARYRRCGDGLIVATSRDQKPGLRKFRYLGTRSTHNAPFAAELAPFVGLFFPNRSQNPRNVRERGLTGGGLFVKASDSHAGRLPRFTDSHSPAPAVGRRRGEDLKLTIDAGTATGLRSKGARALPLSGCLVGGSRLTRIPLA